MLKDFIGWRILFYSQTQNTTSFMRFKDNLFYEESVQLRGRGNPLMEPHARGSYDPLDAVMEGE